MSARQSALASRAGSVYGANSAGTKIPLPVAVDRRRKLRAVHGGEEEEADIVPALCLRRLHDAECVRLDRVAVDRVATCFLGA